MQQLADLSGHTDRVWSLAWNPSGTTLASCSGDKTVRLWTLSGGVWSCAAVLDAAHDRTVRACSWSPDGRRLAIASFDATVSIWACEDSEWEQVALLEGHENEVKCVAWDRDGKLIATCSRDKSVWIWEVDADNEFEPASVLSGHSQDVKQVVWSPTASMLASCSYDDTIKLWREDASEDDWTCAQTLTGHKSTVWSIAFSPDGNNLVSASDDGTLKLWRQGAPGVETPTSAPSSSQAVVVVDAVPGHEKWGIVSTLRDVHSRCIYSVSWHPQSAALIASGGSDDALRVFSCTGGVDGDDEVGKHSASLQLLHVQDKAHAEVNCVAWHPAQADLLASCGDDMLVRLWRIPSS